MSDEKEVAVMVVPELAEPKAVVAADPDWYSKLPITGDQSGKWCVDRVQTQAFLIQNVAFTCKHQSCADVVASSIDPVCGHHDLSTTPANLLCRPPDWGCAPA